MEKLKSLLISLATSAILMEFALATDHVVGAPDGGWDVLTAVQAWASSSSFIVGDNLVFSYGPTHDVLQVSKEDYESCNPNNAITVYAGGLSTIPLTTPGKKYFICGTIGHCALGMKVEIDVLLSAAPPTPPSPPTIPLTPPQGSPPTPSWAHAPWSPPGPTYAPWSVNVPTHAPLSAPEPVKSPILSPSHSPHYSPKQAPSQAPENGNEAPNQAVSDEAPTTSPAPAELPPPSSVANILKVRICSAMGSIFTITMLLIP